MKNSSRPELSTLQLLLSLLLALIAGAALTIFVVLPAESGIDLSGFGSLSGLDQLSYAPAAVPDVENDPDLSDDGKFYIAIDPATTELKADEYGDSIPALDGANIRVHEKAYKSETIEIHIQTDGSVEYKAIMERGEVLLYQWESDGEIYYDFHAHQVAGKADFWTRYSEGEANRDQGSIVAPYQGQHGWFWMNIEGRPITVKLSVAGYYEELIEIRPEAEEENTDP